LAAVVWMPPPIVFAALKWGRWAWLVAPRSVQERASSIVRATLRQRRWQAALAVGAGGAFLCGRIDRVPVNGRWRVLWLSDGEIATIDSIVQESEQLDFSTVVEVTPSAHQAVQRVVDSLVANSTELQSRSWTCHILPNPEFGAWSYQSGSLYLTRGLCDDVTSQSELACILGHEMAHVVAKHAYERFTLRNLLQAGSNLFFWTMAVVVPDVTANFQMIALTEIALPRLFHPLLARLPFERRQEYEADYLGGILAARAGYDPAAFLDVCDRQSIAQDESRPYSHTMNYFDTHPMWRFRRERVEAWLPEARGVLRHGEERRSILQAALEERALLEAQWSVEAQQIHRRSRPQWWWRWWHSLPSVWGRTPHSTPPPLYTDSTHPHLARPMPTIGAKAPAM
jgi:Zn-dependent protease with chaperone function